MKNAVTLAILIFVIIGGFLFRTQIAQAAHNILYQSPCDTVLTYSIGNIDSRFSITRNEVLQDALTAQNVWNSAEHKTVLSYDAKSPFTVNLVYDGRQKLNSQINDLNSNLNEENNALKPEISNYEAKVADFKSKLAAFNQEVNDWNSKGGAPPDVYKSLVEQQKSLEQEAQSLNEEARSLNQSTQEYNVGVQQLNQTINSFNTVLKYKPEEGLFTQEGNTRKISIFFYSNKQELIHTLTHEMGHALGLSHVNDETAIMFPETNNVTTPSSSDLTDLANACSKRNIITERISLIIQALKQKQNP